MRIKVKTTDVRAVKELVVNIRTAIEEELHDIGHFMESRVVEMFADDYKEAALFLWHLEHSDEFTIEESFADDIIDELHGVGNPQELAQHQPDLRAAFNAIVSGLEEMQKCKRKKN